MGNVNYMFKVLKDNRLTNSNSVSNREFGTMSRKRHIKPLLFGKISKMHKPAAFIPRFA